MLRSSEPPHAASSETRRLCVFASKSALKLGQSCTPLIGCVASATTAKEPQEQVEANGSDGSVTAGRSEQQRVQTAACCRYSS